MAINTKKTFEYYDKEASYVSPTEISGECARKIIDRNRKLGKTAIFGNL